MILVEKWGTAFAAKLDEPMPSSKVRRRTTRTSNLARRSSPSWASRPGKTSLLDNIRRARARRAIAGALPSIFGATTAKGSGMLTFLDTPGTKRSPRFGRAARSERPRDPCRRGRRRPDAQTREASHHARRRTCAGRRRKQDRQARGEHGTRRAGDGCRGRAARGIRRRCDVIQRFGKTGRHDDCSKPCCCRPRCGADRPVETRRWADHRGASRQGKRPGRVLLVQSGTLRKVTSCWSGDLRSHRHDADENGKPVDEAGRRSRSRFSVCRTLRSGRRGDRDLLKVECARDSAVQSGQVPRGETRESAGREARMHVRPMARGEVRRCR